MGTARPTLGRAVGIVVVIAIVLLLASSPSRVPPSKQTSPSALTAANAERSSLASLAGPLSPPVSPSVGQTTVLINNTVYPGLYRSVDTLTSGQYPEAWGTTPAYDPATNLFYEPASNVTENATAVYYGGYLAAISPTTDRLVHLIPVGLIPDGVTFDSSNGLLYVLDYDNNNVSIVDPSTNTTVGSLAYPSGNALDGSMAVNNSSGQLYLGSAFGVYDLNVTNDLFQFVTGSYQDASSRVVFDNQTREVYEVGTEVMVIGPNNDSVWKTIPLTNPAPSPGAGAPTVDWRTDELYVPWDNNTTAVELATNTLGPTLTLSSGEGVAPAATFDPDNGMVYVVTDYPNYNVTELNPATHRWVASSPAIPSDPWGGIAYSPESGRLLLAGATATYSSGFLLMSPSLQLVGQPLSLVYPEQTYFDPFTGYLFVLENGLGLYGNASVVDPATGKILGYVAAGLDPRDIWVDPNTGYGYIANFGPPPAGHVDNLTVFNARTFATTGSIPVGTNAYSLTYDPDTGYLYVVNTAGNITVIDPATNSSVGSIDLSGITPGPTVFDPSTTDLYVVGSVSGEDYGEIATVDPSTGTVVGETQTYFQPYAIAYDAATGLIYIQDTNSSVYVLQKFSPASGSFVGSINLYQTSLHLGWDPVNDLLYATIEVNSTNGGYDANIVTEVNVTSGALVNLTVGELPNGIAIDAATGEAFVSDQDSGSVVFIDPGAPAPSTYTVTFQTVPTSCSITFNGVTYTNGEQASGVAAGTYSLVAPACTGETFSSWSSTAGGVTSITSASTTVTVSATGTITATFTATSVTTYTLTFQTTPTSCSIDFDGTTYANAQQASGVAAGTYPLVAPGCAGEVFTSWSSTAGTVSSPSSSSTTVTVSSSGTIAAAFTPAPPGTYLVTFTETGLPTGTSWTVTLQGTPSSSTTDTIQFSEGNDTYTFAVGTVSGYTAAPSSGSLVVSGGPVSKQITFTASAAPPPKSSSSGSFLGLPGSEGYELLGGIAALLVILLLILVARRHKLPIVFTEVGLPPGTRWSVALDGNELSADVDVIMFTVHSGKHMYRVGSPLGFTPSPAAGTVELKRERIDVHITFAPPARKY